MIPASFAPMILKMILGKTILPKLTEAIGDNMAKMFKLPQIVEYMELPNDADLLGQDNKEQIGMLAGELARMDDRIKKLEILNGKFKKLKKNGK